MRARARIIIVLAVLAGFAGSAHVARADDPPAGTPAASDGASQPTTTCQRGRADGNRHHSSQPPSTTGAPPPTGQPGPPGGQPNAPSPDGSAPSGSDAPASDPGPGPADGNSATPGEVPPPQTTGPADGNGSDQGQPDSDGSEPADVGPADGTRPTRATRPRTTPARARARPAGERPFDDPGPAAGSLTGDSRSPILQERGALEDPGLLRRPGEETPLASVRLLPFHEAR